MPPRTQLLRVLMAMVAAATLAGCETDEDAGTADDPTDVDATAFEPTFHDDPDCFGIDPAGLADDEVTCGLVEVPLDHDDPEGETIHLAVSRYAGNDPETYEEPLLLLGGGPGQIMVEQHLTLRPLRRLMDVGPDVIVVDQRGVGASEPALECPDLDDVETRETVAEDVAASLDAMAECRRRLDDQGIDLSAFHHLANARDVDLVRRALGHDRLNLQGTSYGTHVALLAAETFPEAVRTVTLSSPVDPRGNWVEGTPVGVERALDLVAQRCAEDEDCDEELGDLQDAIDQTVDRLAERPEEVTVRTPGGEEVTEAYTPAKFAGGLIQLFYNAELLSLLPAMVDEAREGDLTPLAWVAAAIEEELAETISDGMRFSMLCSAEAALASPEAALADVENELIEEHWFPASVVGGEATSDACDLWDVELAYDPATVELDSEVPTLIVTGEFDHVTPPQLGEQVHEALRASHLVHVPGASHGPLEALSLECRREVMGAFLVDPERAPDDRCAARTQLVLRTTLPPGFGMGLG
jgi:pimeloyl-ACP methyl ester carboxylesterase